MVEQMIGVHAVLVKIFLVFLISGFIIPLITANDVLRFKKGSFIYTMVFQAFATMVAFSGIVVWVLADMPTTMSVMLMVVIWTALMFIEIKKYKVIKRADASESATRHLLKSLFIKITAVQFLLVVAMVVLKVMEAKGAISLS